MIKKKSQINNPYFEHLDDRNFISKYKSNIIWLSLTIIHLFINYFLQNVLDDLELTNTQSYRYQNYYKKNDEFTNELDTNNLDSNDLNTNDFEQDLYQNEELQLEPYHINFCIRHTGCEELLFVALDKNTFNYKIILVFIIIHIYIFGFELAYGIKKKIEINLANIIGLLYMTSGLWNSSLYFKYHYDKDYHNAYNNFMNLSYLTDSMRLITWYYMFGEIVIFSSIIIPILIASTSFILVLIKNLFVSLTKRIEHKKQN